jgi:hypothetical protein
MWPEFFRKSSGYFLPNFLLVNQWVSFAALVLFSLFSPENFDERRPAYVSAMNTLTSFGAFLGGAGLMKPFLFSLPGMSGITHLLCKECLRQGDKSFH